jgi:copper chaperone
MTVDERTYRVAGMTCDHCVASVREEVSAVPGVERVDVELATDRLTVSGEGFTDQAVSAAVNDAGYELAT